MSATCPPLWERRRNWYAPNSLRFVNAFSMHAVHSIFDCDVSAPGLAYLCQHSVSGRSILPGTAMLETAAAAVLTFTGGIYTIRFMILCLLHALASIGPTAHRCIALQGMQITLAWLSSPLQLHHPCFWATHATTGGYHAALISQMEVFR